MGRAYAHVPQVCCGRVLRSTVARIRVALSPLCHRRVGGFGSGKPCRSTEKNYPSCPRLSQALPSSTRECTRVLDQRASGRAFCNVHTVFFEGPAGLFGLLGQCPATLQSGQRVPRHQCLRRFVRP